MVALIFCGVSLEDEVADAFNVSDNAASTCDVEEATYPGTPPTYLRSKQCTCKSKTRIIKSTEVSKSTEHSITIYERKICFSTHINPSLTHQEVVPDVVSETLTKKIRSLTSSIINAAANVNLDAKLTITQ